MDNGTQGGGVISVCEGILLDVNLRSFLDGRGWNAPPYVACDGLAWPLSLTDVAPGAPA